LPAKVGLLREHFGVTTLCTLKRVTRKDFGTVCDNRKARGFRSICPFSTVPKITVDNLIENTQIVAPHN
jgi:hypothetical protein